MDDSRNILVAEFLKSGCEELVFIDADMDWEDEAILRLAGIDHDVAAIAYPKKMDNTQFAVTPIAGPIWSDKDGLIRVSSVGTGFMKIKRHVLQTMFDEAPKFKTGEADIDCAEVFRRSVSNGKRVSGDVDFCYRWRAKGGHIYVDPEVRIGHVGANIWRHTYGSYLRNCNGLGLTHGIERIKSGQYVREDVPGLVSDWDNEGFAAGYELVAASIDIAKKAKGTIVECGSGLTSLVMAATGAEVYSLESDIEWYRFMLDEKKRLGLDSLTIKYSPLVDQEGGRWYSDDIPEPDVVLCDGPKRDKGNRDILFKKLNGYVPRYILVDDTESVEGELKTWADSHNMDMKIVGELRQFAIGVRNDSSA